MRKSYTIKRRQGQRGFVLLFGAVLVLWLVQLALIAALVYAAIHFTLKYW